MTTVGYGDYYPATAGGQIFGMAVAISGVMVLALPVSIVAGTFSRVYRDMLLTQIQHDNAQMTFKEEADTDGDGQVSRDEMLMMAIKMILRTVRLYTARLFVLLS